MLRRVIGVLVAAGVVAVAGPVPAAQAACSGVWTDIAAPTTEQLARDIATIDASHAWAVGGGFNIGDTWIASYDGTSWTSRAFPTPGDNQVIQSVDATSNTDVWAVGSWSDPTRSDDVAYIIHWNGTSFTRFSLTTELLDVDLRAVDMLSSTDVWAVGTSFEPGLGEVSLTAHYDGVSWEVVPTPQPKRIRQLNAVEVISPVNAWAVGSQGDILGSQPLVLHWNGFAWRTFASPDAGGGSALFGVSGETRNRVWAVGATDVDGTQPLIMRWDGTAWTRVPAPVLASPYNFLRGVEAVNGSQAWAVGRRGAFTRPLLLRWNGTEWRLVRMRGARLFDAIDEAPDGSMMITGFTNDGTPVVLQRCPAAV